jgi:hypothetical protein
LSVACAFALVLAHDLGVWPFRAGLLLMVVLWSTWAMLSAKEQ